MKYEYKRQCRCGHTETIEVTRKEACFCLKENEIWCKKCSKCGGNKTSCMIYPSVEIEKDLLLEWGNNENYYFCEQDEDLVLAHDVDFNIILDVLDNHQILQYKRDMLVFALFVMVYNNLKINKALANKIITELKKRPTDVENAESWIDDYISKVVFPMLK